MQDDFGYTALHAASQKGHLKVADTLIKRHANVGHQDKVQSFAFAVCL